MNISQCIHISKHRVVYFKDIQFLIVNYTSIKLEKKGMHKKSTKKATGYKGNIKKYIVSINL